MKEAAAADGEAAIVTFAATASGIAFLGMGAAFRGIVIGIAVHLVCFRRRQV